MVKRCLILFLLACFLIGLLVGCGRKPTIGDMIFDQGTNIDYGKTKRPLVQTDR